MLMAAVYGALAFHCDNEAAIDEAIREAREIGEQLGARTVQSATSRHYLPEFRFFTWRLRPGRRLGDLARVSNPAHDR